MTLDPAYLEYPRRRLGYDHDLYDWSALKDRPPVGWNGVALWVVISLEWFPIVPSDTPFRAPGHMATPYPDYRHYTSRDYGTRVGFYRLLDAFAEVGANVSVAANAAIAERYPRIVADIVAAGHEIVAHSTDMNGTIATGLPVDDERTLIGRSLDTLERVSGTRPRGWLSIARSESGNTPDLLREAGIDYTCDWVNDELPWRFRNGLVNLPLNHELSDRQILTVQGQSTGSYAEQVCDAFDLLAGEAATSGGGRMLPLHLTPYIIGLPYRMAAFEVLLADLASRAEGWFATGSTLCDIFEEQS